MAIVAPNPITARITKALGLENCRSVKLTMEVGSAVAVVTEQYVSGNQLETLATELETNEWVLVQKKWHDERGPWLTPEEREAIKYASRAVVPTNMPYLWRPRAEVVQHAATLRNLLERLK